MDERYAAGGRRDVADAFPFEHGQIDLAPMVREEVLLGIPDAPLCRPTAPGCARCAAPTSATVRAAASAPSRDERWSVLDQLRERLEPRSAVRCIDALVTGLHQALGRSVTKAARRCR